MPVNGSVATDRETAAGIDEVQNWDCPLMSLWRPRTVQQTYHITYMSNLCVSPYKLDCLSSAFRITLQQMPSERYVQGKMHWNVFQRADVLEPVFILRHLFITKLSCIFVKAWDSLSKVHRFHFHNVCNYFGQVCHQAVSFGPLLTIRLHVVVIIHMFYAIIRWPMLKFCKYAKTKIQRYH